MLLNKSIHKVKNVFHKKMRNIKSLVSKKLSRASSFNAVSTSKNSRKLQQVDSLYRDISEESETDHDEVAESQKSNIVVTNDWNVSNGSFRSDAEMSISKTAQKVRVKEEKIDSMERGRLLAEKIKELEMVDAYDNDHIMDIEEALHHYSLLTCPVYQDIVDKFFMDMYSEFLLPQPSASINNSIRRLHSMRL